MRSFSPLQLSEDGAGVQPEASPSAVSPSRARIKLANVREKIKLLRGSRAGAPTLAMDMGDVIEEAQLNKSAVLNTLGAAAELIQNLSVPPSSRRAVHLREIAELGRHIRLPNAWFKSEQKKIITWYHVVQNLKLAQFEEGDVVFSEGQPAERALWFLGDKTENSQLMKRMEAPSSDPVVMRDVSQAKSLGMAASSIVRGPTRDEITSIPIWQGVGLEALHPGETRYNSTVVAAVKGAAAVLTKQDYATILSMLQHVSTDSMKVVSLMLRAKQERGPQDNKDIAGILSVFDMFNTMDDEFRMEAAALVEYMCCPEGFVLFEEGDRADFNYIVLQGNVRMIKHHQEIETKTTGQQFGSALNIVNGKKKRPCTAICTSPCEMAIMSRISYNRIVKKQLQDVMLARSELLKSLANVDTDAASLQRIGSFCADEAYSAGATIVSPQSFPFKVLIIMEGEAKEVWDPDDVNDIPPPIDSIENARPLRNYQPMRKSRVREKRKKQKGMAKDAAASADALTPSMPGHCFPTGPRKHAVELAKLGKGDIVNGLTLLGRPPQFNVIAHTKVKVLSFDSETSETAFGPQLFSRICKLVQAKHNWCHERLLHNLAVRQTVGASNLEKKQAADPSLRSSSMAHFLDHYVPEDAGADGLGAHKSHPSKPAKPVNDEPDSKGASPRASDDAPDAYQTKRHATPYELSAIRSTLVKGKDPPPPPPVKPWHSASCPPHLANFREAIANAAAEAAKVTNLVMRSSAATAGGMPPSFVQELMSSKGAQPEEAYAPASPYPPGWGPAEPVFAGQVCTTMLDMDMSRTMQGARARRSPDRDAFRRQPSQGAGRAPSQPASRLWTSGNQSMPPLKPSTSPSSPSPLPPLTSTTPRSAANQAANLNNTTMAANPSSLQHSFEESKSSANHTQGRGSSCLSQRSGGSQGTADGGGCGGGGLQGPIRHRAASRDTSLPVQAPAAATPAAAAAAAAAAALPAEHRAMLQAHPHTAHTAPSTLHSLAPQHHSHTPNLHQPGLSHALSVPTAHSPPSRGPVFHTHKGPPALPSARAELSKSRGAEGGGGAERGVHPHVPATLSASSSAADIPSWLNKDGLPHLPNSPHPLLVSDTLRQRMLQQPCSSPATARYTRQRTSTLVSNSTDLPQHTRPVLSSTSNPWLPTTNATTTFNNSTTTTTTTPSSSSPWLDNAAFTDTSTKGRAGGQHHGATQSKAEVQHAHALRPATISPHHPASTHQHQGHLPPPSPTMRAPPLVPPLRTDASAHAAPFVQHVHTDASTHSAPLVPHLRADVCPPSSAASVASNATRRSQAALGASVLKPRDASGQGDAWDGSEDSGVVILPHMMTVYHGILDNDRGFYSKGSQGLRWPTTQQKQRDTRSVSLRSLASQQSRGSNSSDRGSLDAGDGHGETPRGSRLQSPSTPPLRKRPLHNAPMWGGFGMQKQAPKSKARAEPSSPRADEPHLPLDRDEGAPALQDHTLSDPTLDDISYILHRWGQRWHEERAAAIHRRKQREAHREAQMQGVSGPDAFANVRSSTESERLLLEAKTLPTFGVPCAAYQPHTAPQYPVSSVGSLRGFSSNGSSRPTSRASEARAAP